MLWPSRATDARAARRGGWGWQGLSSAACDPRCPRKWPRSASRQPTAIPDTKRPATERCVAPRPPSLPKVGGSRSAHSPLHSLYLELLETTPVRPSSPMLARLQAPPSHTALVDCKSAPVHSWALVRLALGSLAFPFPAPVTAIVLEAPAAVPLRRN